MTATTTALRPEEWPEGWSMEGTLVWHSRDCRRRAFTRLAAHKSAVDAVETLSTGAHQKLLRLARAVLKDSTSKVGPKHDLASLVLDLFDPVKI